MGECPLEPLKPDQADDAMDPFFDFAAGQIISKDREGQGDVGKNRLPFEKSGFLGNQTKISLPARFVRRLAVNRQLSSKREQAADAIQEGGLAAPGWSDDCRHAASRDRETNTTQHFEVGIFLLSSVR